MTPYLQAFTAYHAHGDQEVPWTEAMDFHLQRGAVVSTPALFVMARPTDPDWEDERHIDISETSEVSDTWHIYAAAGDLTQLLALALSHGIDKVTYQRRGRQKLHRLRLSIP